VDGIHDLGGREGFGPIGWQADEHAPAFHEPWQARTWAICMFMFAKWRSDNDGWTLDWWRHVIERIDPADYLTMNYFDKWAQSCMAVLIDDGTAELRDFVGDAGDLPAANAFRPGKRAPVAQGSAAEVGNVHDSVDETATKPAFQVGDAVRGKLSLRAMHTRLPAYARGRCGVVSASHGMQVFPDASAKGEIRREPLYTVAFSASLLWPEVSHVKDRVYVDLWESYLEPAP